MKTYPTNTLVVSLLALGLVATANATPTVFSSRAAWQSTTSSVTNLDFESLPANSWLGASTSSPITINGVTFRPGASYGDDGYLFTGGPYLGYDIGSGQYLVGGFNVPGSYTRWTDITFPTGFDSIGLDLSTYASAGAVSVTATTNLGSYVNLVSTPYGGSSFYGLALSSGETLTSVRVTEGDGSENNFLVDNVSYGNHVPDTGSTIGLLGLGLAMMAIVRRRARTWLRA